MRKGNTAKKGIEKRQGEVDRFAVGEFRDTLQLFLPRRSFFFSSLEVRTRANRLRCGKEIYYLARFMIQ